MTEVISSQSDAEKRLDDAVVAVGNFDGMHIGHQAIFDEAVAEATGRGATVVALTFEPHPIAFFRPDEAPVRLSPPPYKFELMEHFGAEVVVALTFDESLAKTTPEAFVDQILVNALKARHVVVGADFRFGKGRAGDTQTLQALGEPRGMGCAIVDSVTWRDEPVSSTRIRSAVKAGRMSAVRAMLGRPYRLYGDVVRGEARGRALGFPTANLDVADMALPAPGVYATALARRRGERWRAITNIGHRPTFGGGALTVETFVLDDSVDEELDLYGESMELDLYRRVREEQSFDSPDELVAQIERDIAQVRNILDREEFDGRR